MVFYVGKERIFCLLFLLPGHMNQVIKPRELEVVIDHGLRLLIL